MIDAPRNPPPETPRSEPEILPPTRAESRSQPGKRPQRGWPNEGVQYIKFTRIGPFRLAFWAFATLLFVALVLFLFAGALLIAIPAVGAVLGISFAAAWLRRTFKR